MIHSASSEFYSQHQKQYHQHQHRSNYLNGGGGDDRWCRPTLIDPPPRDEAFQQTLEQLRLNSRDTLSPAQLEQLQLKAMPPMMMKKKNGGKKIAKKDKDNKDGDDGDDHDDGRDPEVNEGDEGDEENAHPANHQLRAPAHRETHPLAQHKIETIKNHYHLMLLERHLAQPPTSETEEVAKAEEAEGGVAQASSAKRSGMTGGSEKDPDEEHQADINGHHNGKGSANGMASITPGKATTSGSSSRQNGSSGSSNGGHSTRHSIGHSISNLFSKWTHSKSHNDGHKKSLPAVVKLAEPQSPTHQLDESTLIVFGQKGLQGAGTGAGAGAGENVGEKKAQFSKLKKNSKFFKHALGQDLEGAEEGSEEEENIEADEEEAKSTEKQGRLSKLKRSKTIAALKFFNFKSKRRSASPNQTSSSSSSSASFSFPSSSSHPCHLPESSTLSLATNHHHPPHPPHPSSKSFIKSHLHLSNAKKASKQDESVDDNDDQSGSHFINSKVHSIDRAKSSSFNLLSSRPPIYQQQQQQQQKSLIVAPVTSVNYSSKATTFAFDKEHRAEELNTEVFASGKHKQQHFQHIPSKNLLKPPPASSSSAEHHRSKPSTSKTEGGGGGSLTSLLFGARLRKSQSVHESSTSSSSVTPVHKAVENSSNTSSSSSSNHHHHQTTTTSFFKSFARSKQQRRKNASSSDVATAAAGSDHSSPPLIGKHQRHHRSMVGLRRIHSNTGANSARIIISSLASTSGGSSSSGVKSVIRRRQSQNQLNSSSSRTPIDQANQAKDRISKRLSLPADLNLPFNFVNRILTEKEMEEELARAKREGKIGIIGRDYIRPSMRGFARQVAAARRGGNSGNGNAGTSGNDSEFTDEDFADLATSPTLFAESPEIIGLFSPLLSDDNTPLSRRIRRQSLVSETNFIYL